MKAHRLAFAVRIALTAVLCGLVWANAHWSVALAITLLSAANELNTAVIRRRLP